ncbi:MAG TPA: helix-hairpin-helix domain-containing protein [Vicinamibacterales bacterium]|nr:helix-hairpin-helix domain-containing protein [Vicinamibacterales bacterium]
MPKTGILIAAAIFAAAAAGAGARQAPMAGRTLTPEEIAELAKTMPEGANRELTVRVCGACHEPQRAASVRLTREGWETVVAKMVGLGAKGTDEELGRVVDYLAEHYKGEAAKPINLNTAPAIDLESVAGLLRKEAALWIKYRNDVGPCKSIDDLKKVPGFPFNKVDTKRDRLVCF